MKKLALTAALLLLFVPVSAQALNTDDLLALVAMPLAVDAVANTHGVDLVQLASLVANLNEANVPPTTFVQELRYTPVALTSPQLVTYVHEQRTRGVTGYALGESLRQRLVERYYVTPVVIEPTRVLVVDDNYIPPVIVTRVTELAPDPLAFVDMPLVVADARLPYDQLTPLVTSLNQAYVPPAQFVRVVNYAPTAQPEFVPFVQRQVAQGVSGPALVSAIDQRGPATTSIRTTHPHGGPPGQLKKVYGYQTGAQVVHGTPPPIAVREHGHGRGHGRSFVAAPQPQPVFVPQPIPQAMPPHGHGRGPQGFGPPGHIMGGGNGQGHGNGNGHDKGHGKD